MAKELVPGWDACSPAGCIGEAVVKENCVGSGALGKLRCSQAVEPVEHRNYTELYRTTDP